MGIEGESAIAVRILEGGVRMVHHGRTEGTEEDGGRKYATDKTDGHR